MATGITGITAEAIQKTIQDALAAQAEIHRTELAALAARKTLLLPLFPLLQLLRQIPPLVQQLKELV